MTLSTADLKMSHYCATVTDAWTAPDHPIRRWLPAHLEKLAAELAMSHLGHQSDSDPAELHPDEPITAAQAAAILGLSRRQVQRIARTLDGRIVCGRWLFNKQTVIDYAEGLQT
jgi:helix-turn-helix protein